MSRGRSRDYHVTQLLPTKHETKPILGALHATHPLCRRCETRTTLSARPETSRFPIYYRRFRGLVSIICVDRYLSDVWHAAPKFGLITEGLLEAQRVGDGWFHCASLATDDIIGGSRDYYNAELAHRSWMRLRCSLGSACSTSSTRPPRSLRASTFVAPASRCAFVRCATTGRAGQWRTNSDSSRSPTGGCIRTAVTCLRPPWTHLPNNS